jgi:hypothetical protein
MIIEFVGLTDAGATVALDGVPWTFPLVNKDPDEGWATKFSIKWPEGFPPDQRMQVRSVMSCILDGYHAAVLAAAVKDQKEPL